MQLSTRPSLPSIRSRLVMLVLACAAPILVGYFAFAHEADRRERAHVAEDAGMIARALAAAVDRDLDNGATAARTLASQAGPAGASLAALHATARSLLRPGFPAYAFVLSGSDGRALLDTRRAFGDALPSSGNEADVRAVFASGDAITSGLHRGDATQPWVISITVPVWRGGRVVYALSAELRPRGLNELLANQQLPAHWRARVFDRRGRLAARSEEMERDIGMPIRPELAQALAKHDAGLVALRGRDAGPEYVAYARTEEHGWVVAIAYPYHAEREILGPDPFVTLSGIALMLALGLVLAWRIGEVIARSVRGLAGPAAALGRGEPLVIPPLGIREADAVARALRKVEGELQQYRSGLESLVADRTRELQRSNAQLATVYATAPVGLAFLDRDLRIVTINDYLAAMNALPVSAHIGRSLPELLGARGAEFEKAYRQVAATGRPLIEVEVSAEVPAEPGVTRHWICSYYPMFGPHRELLGINGVVLDITGRVDAEAALRAAGQRLAEALRAAQAASSAKGEFLANMSHEIRTPMNAIVGMARLLEDAGLGRRERGYAARIRMAARSLLSMLNDVLDYSKVEAGQLALEQTGFQLDGVLASIAVLSAASAWDKGIELVFAVAPAVPRALLGDPMRLERVLLNLAGNAIKFTAHGEVVLAIEVLERAGADADTSPRVRLGFSVRDTGIGIAPDQQQRMFEAFSQADSSTSRKYGGTGLGLAISRRLVDLMGGRLEVDSQLGQGAAFRFDAWFGVGAASEASPADASPALRVLVADDNASSRSALATLLAARGWQVDQAASGAEALALLRGGSPYDLAFIDSVMPDLGGVSTISLARAARTIQMPRCALLAADPERERLDALAADLRIDTILAKPFTPQALEDALAELLGGDASEAGRPAAAPGARLAGLRVLVVEDNLLNQEVAKHVLAQAGASVDFAANGRIGVAMLAEGGADYDAVLMDLQMPVMDGFAATALIRRLGLAVPIVAMTANAVEDDRRRALAAGVDAWAAKPIDVDELVATLGRLTGRAGAASPAQGGATQAGSAQTPAAPDQLPGIDLQAALARLGGDRARLAALLRRFAAPQAGTLDEIGALLAAQDHARAAQAAHRLRGVAANLGALDVARQALDLEHALAPEQGPGMEDPAALARRLACLREALDLVHGAALALETAPPGQPDAPPSAPAPGDSDALRGALALLVDMLQNNNMKAMTQFETVRPALRQLAPAREADLADALAELRFEEAAGMLREVLAAMEAA